MTTSSSVFDPSLPAFGRFGVPLGVYSLQEAGRCSGVKCEDREPGQVRNLTLASSTICVLI